MGRKADAARAEARRYRNLAARYRYRWKPVSKVVEMLQDAHLLPHKRVDWMTVTNAMAELINEWRQLKRGAEGGKRGKSSRKSS